MADPGLIPGLGRSLEKRMTTPLQYFCLENSTNEGAWMAVVHGVTKSDMTEPLTHIIYVSALHLLSSFYRRGNWGLENLSKFSKVTRLVNYGSDSRTHVFLWQYLKHSHKHAIWSHSVSYSDAIIYFYPWSRTQSSLFFFLRLHS